MTGISWVGILSDPSYSCIKIGLRDHGAGAASSGLAKVVGDTGRRYVAGYSRLMQNDEEAMTPPHNCLA
jgi:hypothetical protein